MQTETVSHSSWLRLARETAGLTQAELGELVDRTQAQISRYEGGERKPRPETLERLEQVLKVEPGRVFSERGPTPEQWMDTYLRPNGSDPRTPSLPDDDGPPGWDDPDNDPDIVPVPPELRAGELVLDMRSDDFRVEYFQNGKRVGVQTTDGFRFRVGGAVVHIGPAGRRTPGRSNRPAARRTRRSPRGSPDGDDGPGESEPPQRRGA